MTQLPTHIMNLLTNLFSQSCSQMMVSATSIYASRHKLVLFDFQQHTTETAHNSQVHFIF